MKWEVRISGFGGQGVILAGYIIGKAAAIYGGMNSTLIRNFGPESRGGAAAADVFISQEKISYPYVKNPDILVTLSQEAYNKHAKQLQSGKVLIIEKDLIKHSPNSLNVQLFEVPATKLAENLQKKIVMNIVVVGFFAGICDFIEKDSFAKAVESSVPKGTEEINIKAFNTGYDYAVSKYSKCELKI